MDMPTSPAFAPSLQRTPRHHKVVIVGAGAAGIATAASLRARQPSLDIAIVEPAQDHFYQPGWTLVGAGIFKPGQTRRAMSAVMPSGVSWVQAAVRSFDPERRQVELSDQQTLSYDQLVVCPGLKLDWAAVQGLEETLGRNGVTSNYRYDLAPYTWDLVRQWKGGKAVFTQPPLPIKCAGAPQKAMYLACDTWRRAGTLRNSDVRFMNAGNALFGVAAYVPALMKYIESYGIGLHFGHTIASVDGPRRQATVLRTAADGSRETLTTDFELLHVVPPQVAPDFIRTSPLADANGWIDVDPLTLRHKRHANVFALGDAANTPNAKTAAAVRRQAPVVAHNLLAQLGQAQGLAQYDGYGACPLTVERGKIVLAEFLYAGKLAPTFPDWLVNGTQPSRLAWMLKSWVLPPVYWRGMLKGREWLAEPDVINPASPQPVA